jgi:hypothetical protein
LIVGRHPRNQFCKVKLLPVRLFFKIRNYHLNRRVLRQFDVRRKFDLSAFNGR